MKKSPNGFLAMVKFWDWLVGEPASFHSIEDIIMSRRFVDDEGQVTPHSDAAAESENASASAGTSAADVAAQLRAAGVGRTSDERGFTRDAMSQFRDVDVGMDEALRFLQVSRLAATTDLGNVLASVQATRAQNNALTDNFGQLANAFWHSLAQSNGTFNNSLVQNESIETDNEVISTAVLAQMVKALADEVVALKAAA